MEKNIDLDEESNCIYQILRKENNISSKKILELAASDEFSDICTGCVSGDALLRGVKKLEKAGLVQSSLGKGGYKWKLIKG